MKIEDASPKDLTKLLNIAQRRKAQLAAQFKTAQDKFFSAMGANSTIEQRQALRDHADSINAELEKAIACIQLLESRLAGYVSEAPIDKKVQKTAATKKAPASLSGAETSRRFQSISGNILNLLKVQVKPSYVCVEPNDSIIKALFGMSTSNISVTEKHPSKRKPAIVSNIEVQGPLSEYDRAVLGVIISEYDVGNRYTTVNIIHRALIGRPGQATAGFYPRKDQENAIVNSIAKLMGTVVDFSDASHSWKKLKYVDKDGNEFILRKDNLLSASILDAKINGQPVEGVIFFKDNLPLFQIANAKDQIIRYPHSLLNVPNQNNTPLVISLKKYVMRRVCEIKLHSKQLKPTITFDDVFSKCKVDSSDKKKFDARNIIIKFFEHLKAQNFISDFHVKKEGKSFSKISFSFDLQG